MTVRKRSEKCIMQQWEISETASAGRRQRRKEMPGKYTIRGIKSAFLGLLVSLTACLAVGLPVHAEALYTNEETGYQVYIEDDADLLSREEELALAEQMQGITAYGNALFKSIDENNYSTDSFARSYYRECFGTDSGTMFLIDMDNRNIWIRNDGKISRVITDSYSDTITDNCYRYASRGEYYDCAAEAFKEIETLLKGQRIAQPMKYICNAFLAMIFALLITLGLARMMSGSSAPSRKELLKAAQHRFQLTDPRAAYTHTTKRYDPPSDSGGSSSGGGGGGGGSSSGSGGGHSF